jgi:hypothetical protein
MHALKLDPTFDAEAAFADYIAQDEFPCLAAKTAVARGNVTFFHASSVQCPAHDRALLSALAEFAKPSDEESPFRSFVALFPDSPVLSHRRTRAGDLAEAGVGLKTPGVGLGMPSLGRPAAVVPVSACGIG